VSIGENVKRIREEQRYTQTEIARRCGVTPAAISGLEHGDFRPSTSLLARLAEALDVSADELLKEPVPLDEAPATGRYIPVEVHSSVGVSDQVEAAKYRLAQVRHILAARDAGELDDPAADRAIERVYGAAA
jgi:putative transcriptional regulator